MKQDTPTWLKKARAAQKQLEKATPSRGTKMALDQEVAQSVGLSRQSLRNYLAALRFVDSVRTDDEKMADILERQTPTALTQLARAWRLKGTAALELMRRNPTATQAEVVTQVANFLAKHRRDTVGPGPIDLLSKDWKDRLHSILGKKYHGPPAGIIFGNQLRRLSVQPVEWGQLKLVDPKSPFLRAAGVSKIATADWRAFSYCTPKAQQRFRLSETEAAYFILIEAPNLAHIDQLRWAAKDVLFRALAAAQMAPVAVVLAKTPGERDALLQMMPFLPEQIGTPKPTPAERDQQLRYEFSYGSSRYGECLENWRIAPELGLSVLVTSPQTFWMDLYGVNPSEFRR